MHVVKRRGHNESYDSRKIYASVYAGCRNAHLSEIQSEQIADAVAKQMDEWIADKKEVASGEIMEEVTKRLHELHEDAAFLYKTHLDIS